MPLVLFAALAAAVPLDPPVVAGAATTGGAGEAVLLFTNPDARAAQPAPARVAAVVTVAGAAVPVDLVAADAAAVPAAGFARVRYRFVPPVGAGGDATLAVGASRYAFAVPADAPALAAAVPPPLPGRVPAEPRSGRPALANLAPYEPVYAAYGPGTASAAKIQLAFQYQLFGDPERPTGDWKEGFAVAYTQKMFWNVEARSAPFRDVNFRPEAFYRHAIGGAFAARGGLLHESNGRGGEASRSYNIVYLQPEARFALGGYTATIAPRYWRYLGRLDDNPDIARFRGHQSLALAIGRDDGLRLSTVTRLSFGSGKGAVDGELSYPLTRAIGLPLYLVVQGFTGYGEDLRDYDRRQTRVRLGLGVVR